MDIIYGGLFRNLRQFTRALHGAICRCHVRCVWLLYREMLDHFKIVQCPSYMLKSESNSEAGAYHIILCPGHWINLISLKDVLPLLFLQGNTLVTEQNNLQSYHPCVDIIDRTVSFLVHCSRCLYRLGDMASLSPHYTKVLAVLIQSIVPLDRQHWPGFLFIDCASLPWTPFAHCSFFFPFSPSFYYTFSDFSQSQISPITTFFPKYALGF